MTAPRSITARLEALEEQLSHVTGWTTNDRMRTELAAIRSDHVYWISAHEHYQALCKNCDYESPITCDRYQARKWANRHSEACVGGTDAERE